MPQRLQKHDSRSGTTWSVLLPLMLVVGSLAGLYFTNAFGLRHAVGRALGLASTRVDLDYGLTGRVVDASGEPVAGARVCFRWEVTAGGVVIDTGSTTTIVDATGSYRNVLRLTSPELARDPNALVQTTVQAFGPFCDTVPSKIHEHAGGLRYSSILDLELGPPLPTIPVRCLDGEGNPVTEFWVKALRVGGATSDQDGGDNLPFRHKDFADGIAQLAVPPAPFRVLVHDAGERRKATVGPFDSGDLPDRIDVTLPRE